MNSVETWMSLIRFKDLAVQYKEMLGDSRLAEDGLRYVRQLEDGVDFKSILASIIQLANLNDGFISQGVKLPEKFAQANLILWKMARVLIDLRILMEENTPK